MVVTTGFFDGVHRGHRKVIEQLVRTAAELGDESRVVTFWPHPRSVLQNEARDFRLLNSLPEKLEMLRSFGVDKVEVLEFTKQFSSLTALEYFEQYVKGMYGGRTVVFGYDNLVGCDCRNSADVLAAAGKAGLQAIQVDELPFGPDGKAISSTRIRKALEEGKVSDASAMLGYDYSLHGVVVGGNKMGRTFGFPTANIQMYDPLKLIPGNGVYAVGVKTLGKEYRGMCNIGVRPTVGTGNQRTIETNIFDFNEDIYGLDIKISFIGKIRDERPFPSLDALAAQLALDRDSCLKMMK